MGHFMYFLHKTHFIFNYDNLSVDPSGLTQWLWQNSSQFLGPEESHLSSQVEGPELWGDLQNLLVKASTELWKSIICVRWCHVSCLTQCADGKLCAGLLGCPAGTFSMLLVTWEVLGLEAGGQGNAPNAACVFPSPSCAHQLCPIPWTLHAMDLCHQTLCSIKTSVPPQSSLDGPSLRVLE